MTAPSKGACDYPCGPDNVHAHALELLRRRAPAPRPGDIHLDIGCGYGRIAEPLEAGFARAYVGLDGAGDGLTDLAARGFETHRLRLEGRDATLRQLEEIIAGRPVASITFLDALEKLVNGDEVLAAIAEAARRHHAPVVVSASNVTHRDIGAKLAFGSWNYTATGLLDRGNVRLFDQSLLLAALEKAGLAVVDRHDVIQPVSDQHFPSTHPALAAGTPLNNLLFDAAQQSNPWSEVNQFVWLCAGTREMDRQTFVTVREDARPLVSVVIRTQGRRLHTLEEALLCLCGQTDTDFEVVVVGHKLDADLLSAVETIVEDTPDWLRQKIRLLRAVKGGRAHPLNVGFAAARGRYIAILDDDDIPFANWVEEYRKLDASNPGCLLRATSVRQDVVNVEINGHAGLRAEGSPQRIYPPEFDFLAHLVENHSPNNTLAFPRGAFHDLGLQFDESLDTTEDWDFLLRVSAVCGVASSPEITGVYRWWIAHESSRTAHTQEEWRASYEAILRKQDQGVFIVPKGGLSQIRRLVLENRALPVQEFRPKLELELEPALEPEPALELEPALEPEPAPQLEEEQARKPEPEPAPPEFVPEPAPEPGLDSIDDGAYWGRKLANAMPRDLARATRRGLRRKCVSLRLRIFFSFFSRIKRRRLRHRLRIFQSFLREF